MISFTRPLDLNPLENTLARSVVYNEFPLFPIHSIKLKQKINFLEELCNIPMTLFNSIIGKKIDIEICFYPFRTDFSQFAARQYLTTSSFLLFNHQATEKKNIIIKFFMYLRCIQSKYINEYIFSINIFETTN